MTGSPRSLLDHRKAEFTLVADLERLSVIATRLSLTDMVAQIDDARSRIESHRFSIAVVGEFKRGKSTFINALLGKEILPSDIAPTSATINRVSYGLKKTAKIIFKDGREQFVEIDQLAAYVTKLTPEAETLAATIKEAVVTYPVPFCKNVDIIDTPGLSDDVAMTNVTLGILPHIDAAILVILATAPFAQSEAKFLESLLLEYGLGSVIFVVTAIDRLPHPEKDRERIVNTVTERIRDRIRQHATARFGEDTEAREDYLRRIGEPRVFGLSGYDALMGKIERDEDLLTRSRFPEFETFLEVFLSEERGSVALRTHTERILGFCATLEQTLGRHLAAAGTSTWGETDSEPLEALLRALEWLLSQETRRLSELRQATHDQLRPRLYGLAQTLQDSTEQFFVRFIVEAVNLEGTEIVALLAFCRMRLYKELQAVSSCVASEAYAELKKQILQAASGISSFAIAFDRVLRHVSSVLTPAPGSIVSMVKRLTGPIENARDATAEVVLQATFNMSAHMRRTTLLELHSPPRNWADDVAAQPIHSSGSRIASAPIRAERFKSDLKGKMIEELRRQLELSTGPRDLALGKEIDESFDHFARELEWALDQIRLERARVKTEGHRRLALAEQRMEKVRETQNQIREILARSQQLAKEVNP